MQLDVVFNPQTTESFVGSLRVKYETGEETVTKLIGNAKSMDIFLSKELISFDHKFIGKNASSAVKIVNHSNLMVHYSWKRFSSDEEDAQYKKEKLKMLEEKNNHLLLDNGSVADLPLLQQTLKNERHAVEEDELNPVSDSFMIEPTHGVIWPHSTVEVNAIFSPHIAGKIEDSFYCQVSGLEKRLQLKLEVRAYEGLLF